LPPFLLSIYQIYFQDPKLRGVRGSLIAGNWQLRLCDFFHWHNVHAKFLKTRGHFQTFKWETRGLMQTWYRSLLFLLERYIRRKVFSFVTLLHRGFSSSANLRTTANKNF